MAGHDLAAGRPQLRHERIGEDAGAAADHRPADRVGVRSQHEPERRGQRPIEREHRMGRDPGEQRTSLVAIEAVAGQPSADHSAGQPETGQRQGMPRHVDDWSEELGRQLLRRPARAARRAVARRAHRPRRARPRWPPRIARARRPGRRRADGRSGASGWISSTPRAARSIVRKNGEATVSGRIVEQTSWRNPGRVSSAVRVPPPGVSAASYTRTERPARARVMAAARPLGPAPTTIASSSAVLVLIAPRRSHGRTTRPRSQKRRGHRLDGTDGGARQLGADRVQIELVAEAPRKAIPSSRRRPVGRD